MFKTSLIIELGLTQKKNEKKKREKKNEKERKRCTENKYIHI